MKNTAILIFLLFWGFGEMNAQANLSISKDSKSMVNTTRSGSNGPIVISDIQFPVAVAKITRSNAQGQIQATKVVDVTLSPVNTLPAPAPESIGKALTITPSDPAGRKDVGGN